MRRFCQNPAHYTGFSFLSEGLMLELLHASAVGEFPGRGGCTQGPPMPLGSPALSPGLVAEDGVSPRRWGMMHLPWGGWRGAGSHCGGSSVAFFSKTLKTKPGIR